MVVTYNQVCSFIHENNVVVNSLINWAIIKVLLMVIIKLIKQKPYNNTLIKYEHGFNFNVGFNVLFIVKYFFFIHHKLL